MKRIMLTVFGLAFLMQFSTTNEAQASRARLLVMGAGNGASSGAILGTTGYLGSFSIEDDYNIFYNPGYLNDTDGSMAIIEKNGTNSASAGLTSGAGPFKLGFFLNHGGAGTLRTFDIFIGAEIGVKWGVNFNSSRIDGNNNSFNIRGGVSDLLGLGLDPFVAIQLAGQGTLDTGVLGIGTRYHLGSKWVPFVAVQRANSITTYGFGITYKTGDKVILNVTTSLWDGSNGTNMTIPVEISLESKVWSWFSIRGGASYLFRGGPATTGRVGGAFHFADNLQMDFTVGPAGGTIDTDPFGFDTDFISTASLKYNW